MEKKFPLKYIIALVLTASALTCLVLALILQLNSSRPRSGNTQDYAELLYLIENRFIGSYDDKEITEAAMRAAVEALDDRWSYYMTPEEYAAYLESSDNRYSGIGVEVVVDADTAGIRVVSVYRDSGADRAGIVAGDIITAIDGESIIGFTMDEMRSLLRREIDATAILTVLRADGKTIEITVVYSVVFTDPVSFDMINGNIGYIALKNFESGASSGFISAAGELIDLGADAFIFDVRSNNGGKVGEMTAILDFLLPECEIFISVDRGGNENITRSDSSEVKLPAVVLVNRYSYSGAEYFAAMLGEYGYASIVGEQTTGKNRMQTTIPLSGGGALHISTGQYLTKNRVSLYDTGGLTPDHPVPMSDDEMILFRAGRLEKDIDPQLITALDLLSAA